MRWFNNLKLWAKLLLGFGVTAGVAVIIGISGLNGINAVNESSNNLYSNELVPTGEIGIMAKDFQRVRANLAFLFIAIDQKDFDHDRDVVVSLNHEMDSLGQSFSKTISSAAMREVYDKYTAARDVFLPLQNQVVSLAVAHRKEEARTLMLVGDARNSAHEIEADIDKLIELKRGSSLASVQSSNAISSSSTTTVLVVLVMGILIAVGIGYTIARVTNRALTELVGNAETIANGDLTVTVTQRSEDEVGHVAAAFQLMVQNLQEMIKQMTEVSAAVASASSEISSSTEEMAAGAQEQTSQAGEVASAVEEMTKTIIENSKNASSTAETAKRAKGAAEEGGKIVDETVVGMRRIADVVNKSAATVKALGKSSDQIGEIIGVIDDIADQTNLLALNAAIEAARAGEQGRGFAVVADEVRKLAERTTQATKEIAGMIKTIQTDTTGAVNSMEEGTKEVDNGIRLADRAGSSLKEIVGMIQNLTDMVSQIAAASEEQSSASEQISKNVEAISTVTGQSASGTQQIAKAAEDLNRLTENLQQLVNKFKLLNDDRAERPAGSPHVQRSQFVAKSGEKARLAVRKNGSLVREE